MRKTKENDHPQVLEDSSNSVKFYILLIVLNHQHHQFSDLNLLYIS